MSTSIHIWFLKKIFFVGQVFSVNQELYFVVTEFVSGGVLAKLLSPNTAGFHQTSTYTFGDKEMVTFENVRDCCNLFRKRWEVIAQEDPEINAQFAS